MIQVLWATSTTNSFSIVILPKGTYNTSLNLMVITTHQLCYDKFNIHILIKAQNFPRGHKFRSKIYKSTTIIFEIENKSDIARCAPTLPFKVGHCLDLHNWNIHYPWSVEESRFLTKKVVMLTLMGMCCFIMLWMQS